MGSVNKVILVGNLGRDAEKRYTPGGAAVAKFSVATTEVWTDKAGQRQERTEWHTINLWGKQAESRSEYLTKGRQVYIEGRLQTRKAPRCRSCDAFLPDRDWNARDAQKIRCQKCDSEAKPYAETMVDIRADRISLLGSGSGGRGAGVSRIGEDTMVGHAPAPSHDSPEPLTDDDIPF